MKKQRERWYSDTDNRYRGYRIDIDTDEYPPDPRDEFEPMGRMICFHSRYTLGDEHNYSPETLMQELALEVCPNLQNTLDALNNEIYIKLRDKHGHEKASAMVEARERKIIEKIIDRKYIILELYIYDHGGITMRSGPFSCPWDSGQVGVMVMTKEQARQEYSGPDYIAKATAYMEGEIKEYDAYLTGDVFGWQIYDPEDNFVDSCFGYYGYERNIEYVMSEVKAIIDRIYKDQEDEAAAIAYEAQQQPARQALAAAARWR
jgi:hypothetical protein